MPGRFAVTGFRLEAIIRAIRRLRICEGFLEPFMLIGRVIEGHVQDDAHVTLMSFLQQRLQIIQRSVMRMDGSVIRDVIAMIGGRRKNRHEPKDVDFKILVGVRLSIVQIVQLLHYAFQVAVPLAVMIAVEKRADENFIDDLVACETTCRKDKSHRQRYDR